VTIETDRQVHAEWNLTLVRHARGGKWRIEYPHGTSIAVPTVDEAVRIALEWEADGGRIFTGVVGGRTFDAGVRRARAERGGQS
jgi:hypothetical protein